MTRQTIEIQIENDELKRTLRGMITAQAAVNGIFLGYLIGSGTVESETALKTFTDFAEKADDPIVKATLEGLAESVRQLESGDQHPTLTVIEGGRED